MPREDVLPAAARQHRPELGERIRAEQRVESADDPDPDEQPGIRQQRGDVARSAQNAAPDRVADGDSEAERQAENAQERRGRFTARSDAAEARLSAREK